MVSFLEARYPGSVFECDPESETSHYALRSLTSPGNRAYRASAARQNPPKWFPNMVHKRLSWHNQARNVSRRLDGLKWTAAYVRNALSHWILRHGVATSIIGTHIQRVRHAAGCVSPSATHWWSVIPWGLGIPTISFMFRCSVKKLKL